MKPAAPAANNPALIVLFLNVRTRFLFCRRMKYRYFGFGQRLLAAQPFQPEQYSRSCYYSTDKVNPPVSRQASHVHVKSSLVAKNFPAASSRYIGLIAMASHTDHNNESTGVRSIAAIKRPIVLVGMMGVGKSSIGRKLANQLDLKFVDADDEIEAAAGMTIAEIFEQFGEPYFRDGERRVIARLIDGAPKVIATGGGAFINADTRTLILRDAWSIWLDADIDVLVERVGRRNHRPLLQGRDAREVLTELGSLRNPIYAEADLHIRSDTSPHTRTVENILKALAA